MRESNHKRKGNDTCTMQVTMKNPSWSFDKIAIECGVLGYVAQRKTYEMTLLKLSKFKKKLKTQGQVTEIDEYMTVHPLASKQQLIDHLTKMNFDINSIQKTITRRYDFHRQMVNIFKNNGYTSIQ